MLPRFELTLLALGETLASEKAPGADRDALLGRRVAAFLLSVHRRMPDYLRPVFHLLVLAFDASPLPRRGRPFHALPPGLRANELDRWRRSRIEVRRRFTEFYGSLAAFGLYSDLYGADGCDGDRRDNKARA